MDGKAADSRSSGDVQGHRVHDQTDSSSVPADVPKKAAYTEFESKYWKDNFSDPQDMDCIGNAEHHAMYLKSFFAIEDMAIRSVLDVGFGLGYLTEEFYRVLQPAVVYALDPSRHATVELLKRFAPAAYAKDGCIRADTGAKGGSDKPSLLTRPTAGGIEAKKAKMKTQNVVCRSGFTILEDHKLRSGRPGRHYVLKNNPNSLSGPRCDFRIETLDAVDWARARTPYAPATLDPIDWEPLNAKPGVYHVCICTSVFQYLPDAELKEVVAALADRCYYLYMTVPTDKEFQRQVDELEFHDKAAIRTRSREFYQTLLSKHFTFLSSRILESKRHFNEDNTPFTDLLFRFKS